MKITKKKQKKRLHENKFFFHWASIDCESGLSLTEPIYQKWLSSRRHMKTKKKYEKFSKKKEERSDRILISYSKLSYETKTGLFIAFHLLGTQN